MRFLTKDIRFRNDNGKALFHPSCDNIYAELEKESGRILHERLTNEPLPAGLKLVLLYQPGDFSCERSNFAKREPIPLEREELFLLKGMFFSEFVKAYDKTPDEFLDELKLDEEMERNGAYLIYDYTT